MTLAIVDPSREQRDAEAQKLLRRADALERVAARLERIAEWIDVLAPIAIVAFFFQLSMLTGLISLLSTLTVELFKRSRRQRISSPPGHAILLVSDFLCSARTMDDIVGPTIADMRHEHAVALSQGRQWKALWIEVRGSASLLWALGVYRWIAAAFDLLAGSWRRGG